MQDLIAALLRLTFNVDYCVTDGGRCALISAPAADVGSARPQVGISHFTHSALSGGREREVGGRRGVRETRDGSVHGRCGARLPTAIDAP